MNHERTDIPRVALVTGAISGIGLAIAQRLARERYSVAVHSRAPTEAGQDVAASLPEARYFSADLLDDDARLGLIEQVLTHFVFGDKHNQVILFRNWQLSHPPYLL
jgi:NAD(P)-dependent dehydrogenase (short-subunit alcohol dehydrogenase family)